MNQLSKNIKVSVASLLLIAMLALCGIYHGSRVAWADECPEGGSHYFSVSVITPATEDTDGQQQATCTKCGYTRIEIIPASGHRWSEWITEEQATCTSEGVEYRYCDRHANNIHYEYRLAPTLSSNGQHNYEIVETQQATPSSDGYNVYRCSICGDSYTEILASVLSGNDEPARTTEEEVQVSLDPQTSPSPQPQFSLFAPDFFKFKPSFSAVALSILAVVLFEAALLVILLPFIARVRWTRKRMDEIHTQLLSSVNRYVK